MVLTARPAIRAPSLELHDDHGCGYPIDPLPLAA
jgi:hypothetical protein